MEVWEISVVVSKVMTMDQSAQLAKEAKVKELQEQIEKLQTEMKNVC